MGRDEALAELMATSGPRLHRFAFQLSHDHAAAEDLVQEAVAQVLGSWRRRGGDVGNLAAYVRRAILNVHLGHRRRLASTEVVTSALPDIPDSGFADDHAERDRIWRVLGQLPAPQRAVLVLRYYELLPDREIANLLDAKEVTVRSLAHRGLARLRGLDLVEGRP